MSTIKDSSTYGTLRLWGAVSFGIFSFVGGALLTPAPVNVTSEASQWGFGFVFYGSALLTLVSGFVVLSIMFDKLSTTPAALAAGRQVQGAQSLELPELPVSSPQQEQQQGKRDPADRGVYTHVSTSEEESPGVEQRSLSGGNGITSYEKYARKGGIGGREERGGGGGSIGLADVNGDTIAVWRHITILESLRNVLRQHPESSAFAVIVFLSGVGSGVIETFLFLHLKALGGSGLVMGLARFLTCAAEVPMFQLAGTLQRRYGTWALLALTQLAFAVRFFYYALLRSAWAVLPCELLHGLTFATTWSVSVTYAKHIAPPHCHSLMQTLLGGLHFGLGAGVGSLLGGLVYERVGARLLFTSCGLLSVSSLTIALVAWHICGSNETKAVALEDKEVAAPLSS